MPRSVWFWMSWPSLLSLLVRFWVCHPELSKGLPCDLTFPADAPRLTAQIMPGGSQSTAQNVMAASTGWWGPRTF